jgi:hypothetical protein
MEPEPMPEHVMYQDVLLDDIKEYRKILSGLLEYLNDSEREECRVIRNEFDVSLLEEYDYAYAGLENVQNDVSKHRNEIERIMSELEKQDNHESKKIYQECYHCYIYQYYYLGNSDASFDDDSD